MNEGNSVRQKVRVQLEQLAESDYKQFNKKLLPGVTNILGVRLPKLREIAKQTARQDAGAYLAGMRASVRDADECCYEEKMLFGLVIGYAKMNDNQYKEWLDVFVPVIDNWGVCDSCCMTYKWMGKQPDVWWDYVKGWTDSGTEFGIRFGLVCILDHFVDELHIQEIFDTVDSLYENGSGSFLRREKGYYAKMAAAWLVSVCFVKFPEQTFAFLQSNKMDDFTQNKSIQKTCESYRVTKEWKARIRALKRNPQKQ